MKWFKHMAETSSGKKMQGLEARLGLKGYALYFKILELCASQYDGHSNDHIFVFNYATLYNLLRIKRGSLQDFLRISSELKFWKAEWNEFEVTIDFPKFIETRHKDALSSKNRPDSGPPQARQQPRLELDIDKDKEYICSEAENSAPHQPSPCGAIDEFSIEPVDELLKTVRWSNQKNWIKVYEGDTGWIIHQLGSAVVWLDANPKRRPKNYARFLGGWLSRGWESRRKQIPTQQPQKTTTWRT